MTAASSTFGALSRALSPPGGDPRAFRLLGLVPPDAGSLAREHGLLFGRCGPARVSPYACARDGAALYALLASYAEIGLEGDPGFGDRLDHVCALFAALETMAADEELAEEAGRHDEAAAALAARRAFVARHAAGFAPAFLRDVAAEEDFPLHGALARRAQELLRSAGVAADASVGGPPPVAHSAPKCAACGRSLASAAARVPAPEAAWRAVCAPCRIRSDLRRTHR